MSIETPDQQKDNMDKKWQNLDFDTALKTVCEKYPALAKKIETSLETPQIGEHHNEGPEMKAHLTEMLKVLEMAGKGQFHESISDLKFQEEMKKIIVKVDGDDLVINPDLIDYTFLHDIAKPECLTLKLEGEKDGAEITWGEWQNIAKSKKDDGTYEFNGKKINSISYFHKSEGATGPHGNKGAEMLRDKGVSPEIITAISKHEVAYSFGKISATTYEEHFVKPGFSEALQKFILVASYSDTMASLGLDGKPEMGNFVNLINSRNNYLLIKSAEVGGAKFKENDLGALKKQDKVLTPEDVEKAIQKEEKYNLNVFGEKLDGLVADNTISVEQKADILFIVSSDVKELGKKYGPKMRFIKPLLDQSKE
jgi:hypothetical protein